MLGKKIIFLLITVLAVVSVLCGCNNEFDNARDRLETNKQIKEEFKLKVSDFEISNVEIDYLNSSSYSSYLHVVGIIKNKSNKKASSATLTIYLYQNEEVVLTEKEYVFDLGPCDENSFDFMVDKVKLLTCDKYVVKVTEVF